MCGLPRIVIATPLEPVLVSEIGSELADYQVCYEPELLPPTRYQGDHRGQAGFRRTGDGQRRWTQMLDEAEVSFGIPGDDPDQLRRLVRESARTTSPSVAAVTTARTPDIASAAVASILMTRPNAIELRTIAACHCPGRFRSPMY